MRVYLWTAATGTYEEGALLDILWPLMGILLAVAAWVRPGRSRRIALEGRPLAATPIVCTLIALVVFIDDHFRHINALALVLAATTIGLVLVRTLLTFRENTSIAASIQVLSVTDPLTHLWNRRKLARRPRGGAREEAQPTRTCSCSTTSTASSASTISLATRPATRSSRAWRRSSPRPSARGNVLSTRWRRVLRPRPRAGRRARGVPRATEVALSEVGNGFEVTTALGCVFLPEEASEGERAMQIADQRLYARKHHSLIERGQPHGVLLQALYEREPDLRRHVTSVASLSVALGRRLGLDDDALQEVELGAKLHDIGKLAIPDAILDKPAPLSQHELDSSRGTRSSVSAS